jgi:hypothetical protein
MNEQLAAPASTTPVFPFKKGDEVRVLRNAKSNENGWGNSWIGGNMDAAVGKIGTVAWINPGLKDVGLNIPNVINGYGFPSFVLELVNPPAITGLVTCRLSKEPHKQLEACENPVSVTPGKPAPQAIQTTVVTTRPVPTVGQKVIVNYPPSPIWNGEGVVTDNSDGTIVVRFNRPTLTQGGFDSKYVAVIEPPQTSISSSQPKPTLGRVVPLQERALATARSAAAQLAQNDPDRFITADQVQAELKRLGFSSKDLGNAAGTIFNNGQFTNTGKTVKSMRPGNRHRRIAVWKFVGARVVGGFIVERKFSWGWSRSGNETKDGKNLRTYVFPDIVQAKEEAAYQQRASGSPYRATPYTGQ